MESLLARQPILDRQQRLFAYELLFRPHRLAQAAGVVNHTQAASTVILNALSSIGLERVVGDRRAFVNMSEDLLLEGVAEVLPPKVAVIEVLETVRPTPAVIEAIRGLRRKGYRIALDDFEYDDALRPLLELATFVKLDVLDGDLDRIARAARPLEPFKVVLLAERVETHAVFAGCADLGFELFQGFFFARPQLISGQDIAAGQATRVRLLKLLADPDADFDAIDRTIQQDVGLSYKLLRYVNSASMGLRRTVESIHAAVVLLGQRNIRKWASLAVFCDAGAERPTALVTSALVRARLCELLAPSVTPGIEPGTAFTTGMFSRLDGLLDVSMATAVDALALPEDVRAALVERRGPLGGLLALGEACERGDWARLGRIAAPARLDETTLTDAFLSAMDFAAEIMG